MARVNFNPIIVSVSGTIGEFVVKNRGGKSYLSRRPDFSKRILSPAQKASIKRFCSAVSYAKVTMKDPLALPAFQEKAKKTGKTVYNTIISEYMLEQQAKCKEHQSGAALPVNQGIPERSLESTSEREFVRDKPPIGSGEADPYAAHDEKQSLSEEL